MLSPHHGRLAAQPLRRSTEGGGGRHSPTITAWVAAAANPSAPAPQAAAATASPPIGRGRRQPLLLNTNIRGGGRRHSFCHRTTVGWHDPHAAHASRAAAAAPSPPRNNSGRWPPLLSPHDRRPPQPLPGSSADDGGRRLTLFHSQRSAATAISSCIPHGWPPPPVPLDEGRGRQPPPLILSLHQGRRLPPLYLPPHHRRLPETQPGTSAVGGWGRHFTTPTSWTADAPTPCFSVPQAAAATPTPHFHRKRRRPPLRLRPRDGWWLPPPTIPSSMAVRPLAFHATWKPTFNNFTHSKHHSPRGTLPASLAVRVQHPLQRPPSF